MAPFSPTKQSHTLNDANEKPITLPEGYHLENFQVLINDVHKLYGDLLNPEEKGFIHAFQNLSPPAQSLYVRLVMRKGPAFRVDSLNYNDITNLEGTLQELAKNSLIQWQPSLSLELLLPLFLKKDLVTLAKLYDIAGNKLSKPDLIDTLIQSPDKNAIQEQANSLIHCITRQRDEQVNSIVLLFFGNGRQGLTEFVTNQLGIIRYEDYQIDESSRFFSSRERLDQLQQILTIQEWYEENGKETTADTIEEQLLKLYELLETPQSPDDYIARKAQRTITRLARQLERLSPEKALPAYRHSIAPPSRERQARILEKQGSYEEAWALINAIELSPQHPDEPEKLIPLKRKIAKKLGLELDSFNNDQFKEQHLTLSRNVELNIEAQLVEHLSTTDSPVMNLENQLFMGLFGLLFWDIIFKPCEGAFYNPYQLGPRDLWESDFHTKRKTAFDERFNELENRDRWIQRIINTWKAKFGTANFFVNWHCFDEPTLLTLCNHIPAANLAIVFQQMVENLGYYRNGFPDLIQLTDNGYHLWEVKGPGDTLQSNQIRWLRFFQQHDIPAGVIYVSWADS